jgi:hypothetical protein
MLIFVAARSARRQKWQRPQQLQDQRKNPSFLLGKLSVVGSVEGKLDISDVLIFAEFVSES